MKIEAKSLTHVHLRNCISSILKSSEERGSIKILDAGCGNGELISFLYRSLRIEFPEIQFDIFGFDVIDHGVQSVGFASKTMAMLGDIDPSIDWEKRIFFFSADDIWKFEDNYFDFIVSNQVLEHVKRKKEFFSNIFRCLKNRGSSFHLAPLSHCVHEGHIYLPLAHRIKSYELLYSYIMTSSRIGLGKFRDHRRRTGVSVESFSKRHADYMMFWTSYASQSETLDLARKAGLRADFKFTKEFYLLKVAQIFGVDLPAHYVVNQSSIINAFAIAMLRYCSSVTLHLQKGNEY